MKPTPATPILRFRSIAASTAGCTLKASDSPTMSAQLQTDARERVWQTLLRSTGQAVREWAVAMANGAAKGNHQAARDWRLHCGAIDPVQSDTPSTRVMVQIGTPERPLRIPSPLRMLGCPSPDRRSTVQSQTVWRFNKLSSRRCMHL